MKRLAIISLVTAAIGGGIAFLLWDRPDRVAPPASLDESTWKLHDDPDAGWSLRYPSEWHVQNESGGCLAHDQVLVTNLGRDVEHPSVGSGCTDLWDMRELPPEFVVLELEEPAAVPLGPDNSQRTLPLSLDEALRGGRSAQYSVPHGLWFPVYFDQEHTYLVRAWFGRGASQHDREIAERIVASIRFDLDAVS